ncbi:hypothetical protein SADUNF_Sadunf16G0081300 [Salix dunnii]|uniref:Protein kinase domain-containing protein n=1 Tax=Salix dunnii TaxID=1413687 RepID=A0A835ML73_9ROSI|nr:hypothetical protein SADUNF_Sadunf16G0081300 [Salix dunnii]
MKCFSFYIGDKKDERKTRKSALVQSVSSPSTDHEMGRSASELNSQNVSGTGMGRPTIPTMSQRPSNLRVFTVSELKSATKNFSRSVMGHKQWITEVNFLGVIEHPSLVKLIGYCADEDERGIQRLLIYEFMPRGSVEDHLSIRSDAPLPWPMRLRIAQEAARGLKYLHEEMDFQIIFRDFKSSNILLDEQWNAKLSDFGLARLGPSEGLTHVSTAVVGTMGYAAPEYIRTGRLTSKIDVWSYGVFLYELITGRRPLDRNRPKSEQKLLEWIRPNLTDSKKFKQILDPRLDQKEILRSALKVANIAKRCLQRNPKSRPNMSEVLGMMNQIVDASAEAENPQESSKNMASTKTSRNATEKNKRRHVDLKTGETGWFVRMWNPKLVRTC